MILLALVLALLVATPAWAQFPAQGYVMTPVGQTCATTFTQPTTNQIVCFEASAETLKTWNGSAWVPLTGGGGGGAGVTSINGLAGVVNVVGTANEVIVTPGGSGGGGGGGIGGGGTPNLLAKWTGAATVGNSSITDTGSVINLGVKLGLYANAPPANGQLLIGNATTGRWEPATLTGGASISITNTPGAITISGTGAIPSQFVNVRSYGAIGDGVHDDGPAIQAAVNAGAGGVVYAPGGTYLFATDITVTLSNTTTLIGDGPQRTIFQYAAGLNAVGPMFRDLAPSTSGRDVTFRDFGIDGNITGQAVNTTAGLIAVLGDTTVLYNLGFFRYKATAVYEDQAARRTLISDSLFAGWPAYDTTAFYSIGVNGGGQDIKIQRSNFYNHAGGGIVAHSVSAIGNFFTQNGWGDLFGFGLQGYQVLAFGQPSTTVASPSMVVGNRFEASGGPPGSPRLGRGIELGGGPAIVSGNVLKEQALGIRIANTFTSSGSVVGESIVTNNQIWNTQGGPAITIDTGDSANALNDVVIANNLIADFGTPTTVGGILITRGAGGPIDNVRITGNVMRNITGQYLSGQSNLGARRFIEQDGQITYAQIAFASLPTIVENGSAVYCTNCLVGSSPCSGASTGAIAKRLNGAWVCN